MKKKSNKTNSLINGFRRPISVEMVPVNELTCKELRKEQSVNHNVVEMSNETNSCFKSFKFPISLGMVPVNELKFKCLISNNLV